MEENMTLYVMIGGALIFFFMTLYFVPVNLWITATFSGIRIELMELVFARVRRSPVNEIVNGLISMTKSGVKITFQDLEVLAISGVSIPELTRWSIKASKAGIDSEWKEIGDILLANKDVGVLFMESNSKKEELIKVIQTKLNEDQVRNLLDAVNKM